MTARAGERGSVFIEALVSAAIVAMILAAAFQVTADSAQRRRTLEARREALMIAQSELAAVGSALPVAPGSTEGAAGEDIWRVDMQPCGSGRGSLAGRLYCVSVSVRSAVGGAPLATLNSRRLAPLA